MKLRLRKTAAELFAHDVHPELPLDPDAVQSGVYKWPPHFTFGFLLVVFVGGCLGAAARYWIGLQLPVAQNGWPVGTLFVNLLGAFLLGLLLEGLTRLGSDKGLRRGIRLCVGTGFMGAFTTYSTLAVETNLLLQQSHLVEAGWYMAISCVGGVALSTFGIWVAASHHTYRQAKR